MFTPTTLSLFSLLTLLPSILASPISAPHLSTTIHLARRHPSRPSPQTGKAIYFITNNDENAIAAIQIRRDGTLGEASVTPTGGKGDVSVDAEGNDALPDALVSQGALTIVGMNIFAVNAGSNTISMFAISPSDPLSLTQIGQPAALPGTFPNTIAASAKNSLVCVGTTGSKAGVSCANFDAETGIGAMDALRPFELGQSDPPVGPLNTVSHTFFSEDETMLYTTVKGDPTVNNTGFLSIFSVEPTAGMQNNSCGTASAKLSTQETRSSPNGTAVLFGSTVIPGSTPEQIFVTDASFGAGILTLSSSPDISSTLTARQPIEDQAATCWSTISALTQTAFVTDVARNRIIEMSLQDASILNTIDLSGQTQDMGLIDLRAAGGFVYALSPGNGTIGAAVSVVDVRSKKLVQNAKLEGIAGARAMGMVVLL